MRLALDTVNRAKARTIWRCAMLLGLFLFPIGCASVSNPVADGIPVARLPPEFFAESREGRRDLPQFVLGQRPPKVHRLVPGDVLAILIEGLLGNASAVPVVPQATLTDAEEQAASIGYPIPVRDDGTVSLPQIDPIKVEGMTLKEAEAEIKANYVYKKKIVNEDAWSMTLSLYRKKRHRITVLRQDTGNTVAVSSSSVFGASNVSSSSKRGIGQVVFLPTGENDVLNALAKTGGLPGLDAVNEVLIERNPANYTVATNQPVYVRIPLRLRQGEPLPFTEEDVILHDGDILYIASRDADVFYTGGLLGSRQVQLPRDYDIDILQAIALVNGPLFNGAFSGNNLSGGSVQGGIGVPNPSRLTVIRKTADNNELRILVDLNRAARNKKERILVQSGDYLILQLSPGEALVNYVQSKINITYNYLFLRAPHQSGTFNASSP